MQLTADFPELSQMDSDLTQGAIKALATLSPEQQNSPSGYQIAVYQAANALGLKPKKLRSAMGEGDSFSLPSSGRPNMSKEKGGDIPKEVLEFARLMGRNVKDPKVLARLKKATQRQGWMRYSNESEDSE
jgi:hypothetical protein